MSIEIEFWGVRGSVPLSSANYQEFGGDTSCVSIQNNNEVYIFDAGTGLVGLGDKIVKSGLRRATLILSHAHFDHIIGLPFFKPLWNKDFTLTLVSAHFMNSNGIENFLTQYVFKEPLFPVTLSEVSATLNYKNCNFNDTVQLSPNCHLTMAPLNHPGGSSGYRLNCLEKIISYVTDTEHIIGQDDQNVLSLMKDSDLAIYDATYTNEEFENKKGWGHSTWEEGIRLAQMSQAKRLALYHHDPSHNDQGMREIEARAKRQWPQAFVARQGMRISLP